MANDERPSYLERRRMAGTYRTAGMRTQRPRASARFRASILGTDSVRPENRANYYTDEDIDRESERTRLFNTREMQDAVTEGIRGRDLSPDDMTAYHQRARAIGDYALEGQATPREAAGGIRALGGTLGRARIQEQPRAPILEPQSPGAPPPPPQQPQVVQGGFGRGPVITAPNTGPMDMGPNGRTFDQITGTPYVSDEERAWYLGQVGKQIDPTTGQPVSAVPQGNVGPAGRTLEQVRGTEYLSDAERAWFLGQQQAAAPPQATLTPPRAAIMAPPPPGGPIAANSTYSTHLLTPSGDGGVQVNLTAIPALANRGRVSLDSNLVSAIQQAFPPEAWAMAYYVAAAESGGKSSATNTNADGTVDIGPFQVNVNHNDLAKISRAIGIEVTPDSLRDPYVAARAAAYLSSNGTSWRAWSVAPLIVRGLG